MALDSLSTASYLRVASLAVAGFEFLQTVPFTFRLYRMRLAQGRFSGNSILFFLIRYSSVLVLVVSNAGFFATNFTDETCGRFYLIPPVFKAIQTMISQVILGMRAYGLSLGSRTVGFGIFGFYLLACLSQTSATFLFRRPGLTSQVTLFVYAIGGCEAVNVLTPSAWAFYLVSIVYDAVMTALCVHYLLMHRRIAISSLLSRLMQMMINDGILYLVALTAINVLNLVAFRGSHIQSAAASPAYAAIFIMSQRLLIHLIEASIGLRTGHTPECDSGMGIGVGPFVPATQSAKRELDSTPIPDRDGMRRMPTESDLGSDSMYEQSIKSPSLENGDKGREQGGGSGGTSARLPVYHPFGGGLTRISPRWTSNLSWHQDLRFQRTW